ncbi:MAG: hypothetical protein JJ931_03340 [Henriciella sp.]|nr:hypothetical protein [Henriciella sp.]MBO6694440.1 hypothetical protein [Henriciella sp.]
MIDHITLFYTVAQIAGIFVGFGTLIAFTKPKNVTTAQQQALTATVMAGLLVIVAALLPVLLFAFRVSNEIVWPVSAALVLAINWATIWPQRAPFINALKRRNPFEIMLLFGMEAAVEAPLFLILLPVFTAQSFPFYASMLVFSIVQAASLLMLLALNLTAEED